MKTMQENIRNIEQKVDSLVPMQDQLARIEKLLKEFKG